jgi:hypothetical protein
MNIHTSIAIEEMAVTMKQLTKELRGIREELWSSNYRQTQKGRAYDDAKLLGMRVARKEWDDPKPE